MKKVMAFMLVLLMVVTCFVTVGAQGQYEMIENGDFEVNDELTWLKFITSEGIIEYFDEEFAGGEYSMLIYDRTHSTDTIRQYITDKLNFYGQRQYRVKAKVKLQEPSDKKITGNAVIGVEDSSGQRKWFLDPYVTFTADKWTEISYVTQISWEGELQMAEFYFVTDEADDSESFVNVLIDDCSMEPLNYSGPVYEPSTPEPTVEPTAKPTAEATKKPQQTQKADATPKATEEVKEQVPQNNGGSNQSLVVIGVILIAVGVILSTCSVLLLLSCRKEKQDEKKE